MSTTPRAFETDTLLPIPPHLSYEEAATLPCAALAAWNAFFERKPSPGSRSCWYSEAEESRSSARNLPKPQGLEFCDYLEQGDVVCQRMELTKGKGVEHVLEVGGAGTLFRSVNSVVREGLVHIIGVIVGNTPGGAGGNFEELNELVLITPATLSGVLVGSKAMCKGMNVFLTQHKIKPVIDRIFGWAEAIGTLDYRLGDAHFGKIVIKVD
ncbi:hypothetical protein FRC11_001989 [Ceratobasidium sp. 423]|nr:hypothetical protein FRC11_001989 [Ceratobasidium sp. 423]